MTRPDPAEGEREAGLRGKATLVEARDDVMTAVRTGEGLASALAVLELVARAAGSLPSQTMLLGSGIDLLRPSIGSAYPLTLASRTTSPAYSWYL